MRFLLAFSICLIFFSCGKHVETKYDSGVIKESFEINNEGIRNGKYLAYNENGTIHESANFTNGVLTGQRKLFHPNGNVEIEETYNESGQLNGPYKLYYPSGKIKLEKEYINDKISGSIKVYYASGKLKEDVHIENNEENGPFTEYYENGKIHWKGTYKNGNNEYGLLEEFDSTGMIIKKMMCDSMAICRTFWKPDMADNKNQNASNAK